MSNMGQKDSDQASIFLANTSADFDTWRPIERLFETQFEEKVGFPIQLDESTRLMVHIGAQVLTEGDPDRFRARLILQDISPTNMALLRESAQQLDHNIIYQDDYEASHKILETWDSINKKHRGRIEKTFK